MEDAQKAKEELEELQRHDRSLREAAEKRRSQGGVKIVYPPGVTQQQWAHQSGSHQQ